MDVLWNWPSKRKRCQCVLGPSSELSDVRLAWGRHGEGTEKGRKCCEVVMIWERSLNDRAFEMTAESNGYLGQLPTLSGLQVADPGMADG
jgi:hypothetical protein